ncbi:interferon-induced protein with tetratricopeptide repeats 3 isoform X1 [Carlito syrichta]|uniref:Interferon-induced protein with tetratricopeptide repeats 3 isoform X1 n=1 Tax=Carlito syrichta TaxID=1868482 RepID=A0A1U7UHH4_CARSF|nr:interferon-induced protein with tetratricopeptide repeats 3 isoform X2 [Carlito syrichta]XP_021574888.1 interferon-induced protein with tetratricopeptide repeats 3 isoform X1 [Carlito syrichta]
MSEVTKESLETILPQLKCHFTWNLFKKESISHDLEDRVWSQIEFLNTEYKATMYNLLAYIKHLHGQNEAALECLRQAEELIQQEHTGQAEIRNLVTWGNYAWVYYHMGRLSEAQIYVDKVKQTCQKFSNSYSIECPELDCEEGWTKLKCGKNERAKVCFEKALEEKPNNPEFSSGLAIAMYHLDNNPQKQFSENALKQAIELNPENQYIKVLLALKLQRLNEEVEGEKLVKEALEKSPGQTDVLRNAAKFYQKKGDPDKAIELLLRVLESRPNNPHLYHQIRCCYKEKIRQMQITEDSDINGKKEKIEELKQYATDYLKKALEMGLDSLSAYSDPTELPEEEQYYQKEFNKEVPVTERQQLHQRYCNPQEYHEKSEDTAVRHHLESLSISEKSSGKEELKCQKQNTAENLLPQNTPNYWYDQGLIHKQNGDLLQAAACYEKELGRLLKDAPSGIGVLFLSAPEFEDGSREVHPGQLQPRGAPQPLN